MTYPAFAIKLTNGRLWKGIGAHDAAIFRTRAEAQKTVDGFSGRGALAHAIVVSVKSSSAGVWIAEDTFDKAGKLFADRATAAKAARLIHDLAWSGRDIFAMITEAREIFPTQDDEL